MFGRKIKMHCPSQKWLYRILGRGDKMKEE
jgi:hypothetical protein